MATNNKNQRKSRGQENVALPGVKESTTKTMVENAIHNFTNHRQETNDAQLYELITGEKSSNLNISDEQMDEMKKADNFICYGVITPKGEEWGFSRVGEITIPVRTTFKGSKYGSISIITTVQKYYGMDVADYALYVRGQDAWHPILADDYFGLRGLYKDVNPFEAFVKEFIDTLTPPIAISY